MAAPFSDKLLELLLLLGAKIPGNPLLALLQQRFHLGTGQLAEFTDCGMGLLHNRPDLFLLLAVQVEPVRESFDQ
jgi:hypothetical protein